MNVRTWIGVLSAGTVVLAVACAENDWKPTVETIITPDAGSDAQAGSGNAGSAGTASDGGMPSDGGKGGMAGETGGDAGAEPDPDPPEDGGTSSPSCSPDTWRKCGCTNGADGFQLCAMDGMSFGECQYCNASSPDGDGDGRPDGQDNCPTTWNPDQTDTDNDGTGNVCDSTPNGMSTDPPDADRDGTPTSMDCNDNRADVHPGAPEFCDGVDNDCDNVTDEGCPTIQPSGYVTITYQYTDTRSWNGLSVYHQAMQHVTESILPRVAPYTAPPAWGTGAYVLSFAYGIAVDLPAGRPCVAQNSGSVSCTVHVPAGSLVWANVDRSQPGGGGRACTQQGVSGTFIVLDGRGNAIPTHVRLRPPTTYESCVWEFTAPAS